MCISQVSLDDALAAAAAPPAPPAASEPAPTGTVLKRVRLNQLGYLPQAPKRATIAGNAPAPLPWQLRNARGQVVAEGRTRVFGVNQASGVGAGVNPPLFAGEVADLRWHQGP